MVTAFFDSRSDAEQAIERLSEVGVSRDSIRFMPGDERDPIDNDAGTATRTESGGFWDSLGDWFLPDEDRGTYAEGLRRGGYLLSVEASDAQYERVLDILDDEGTIDIDERAELLAGRGLDGRVRQHWTRRCPVRRDGKPDHRRCRNDVRGHNGYRGHSQRRDPLLR